MGELGDYIELSDERNHRGNYTAADVRGISADKRLIDTKANMDGVSVSSYKVVRPAEFVYVADTSRRGDRIALAYNGGANTHLVSSIYTVFRLRDGLLPEYLYMLFNRGEFDRYARFNSWGSARETFGWEELCRVRIPLPPIETQRNLVAAYEGLQRLAEENETLIAQLYEVCQALIGECKGKYPEILLGECIDPCHERNHDGKYTAGEVLGIGIEKIFIDTKANLEGIDLMPYRVVKPMEFSYVSVTSRNGGKISLAMNSSGRTCIVSSTYDVFKCKNGLRPEYLYMLLMRAEFDRYARYNSWGSAREIFNWDELCRVRIPLPPSGVQQAIVNLYRCMEEARAIAQEARELLRVLCPALIQQAEKS